MMTSCLLEQCSRDCGSLHVWGYRWKETCKAERERGGGERESGGGRGTETEEKERERLVSMQQEGGENDREIIRHTEQGCRARYGRPSTKKQSYTARRTTTEQDGYW